MARKTKEGAQETFALLLDAAEHVFNTKGVARATLSDVAAAAGMTRGAIYWHFKDKAALLHAMCDRAFLPMQALLNELRSSQEHDPLTKLKKIAVYMLTLASQNSRQRRVFDIIFHRCEKTEDLAFFVQERDNRQQCLKRLEDIFKDAVASGQLPPATDTRLSMLALHAYMLGLLHEWLMQPDSYDLTQHAEVMMQIFLSGLCVSPPLKKKKSTTAPRRQARP